MKLAQMLALAMLLGSIPFGHIALRLRFHREVVVDYGTIRDAVGWPGLLIVVALNVAKGYVPVYCFAAATADSPWPVVLFVGLVAVLSHCFPYWLMFRRAGLGGSVILGAIWGLFAACPP